MSALKMFVPADGVPAITQFVLDTVDRAGANACPPIIVGVGIGGTFESAALLAKKGRAAANRRSQCAALTFGSLKSSCLNVSTNSASVRRVSAAASLRSV
jgi:tartrate dehydratase alpha subunit/fumarate hydratase class I-like protein